MSELKPPFVVVCINDKNRPKEIPANLWPKFGEKYTVNAVGKTLDNQIGFVLKELPLGKDTYPYDLFHSRRFGLLNNIVSTAEETAEDAVEELITETLG